MNKIEATGSEIVDTIMQDYENDDFIENCGMSFVEVKKLAFVAKTLSNMSRNDIIELLDKIEFVKKDSEIYVAIVYDMMEKCKFTIDKVVNDSHLANARVYAYITMDDKKYRLSILKYSTESQISFSLEEKEGIILASTKYAKLIEEKLKKEFEVRLKKRKLKRKNNWIGCQ